MAIVKISNLTELTVPANGDRLVIVDISEPLDLNKTKFIQKQNLITPIRQTVELLVAGDLDQVTIDTFAWFFVPSTMDGMKLNRAQAFTLQAGVTNNTYVQVRNLTKYPSNDALANAITIASGATIGTPGTVNANYSSISTNDKLKITVPAVSTTKPYGLVVVLEYGM